MTQLSGENFDAVKGGQMVFFFLDKASKKAMNITKLRLIKWLYLAERASYKEFGEPMIGDRLASLAHGPVPSGALAIIEGKRNDWRNIISIERKLKHQYVRLAPECPYLTTEDLDRFSDAEITVLESTWIQYGSWSSVELERHLHDTAAFPEWQWKKGDGTNWIELETVLTSVGFDVEQISAMVKKITAFSGMRAQQNCR